MSRKLFELGFDRNQPQTNRIALKVDSQVPTWMSGSFIRNGPGMFYVGKQRLNHWFDGVGMLHKFEFDQGKVNYESQLLDCSAARAATNEDRLTYSEFATDPCWGLFGRMRSMFQHGPTDSAKVNLAKIGEQYFALGETTMQIEFDIDTLESIGQYNFNQPKFGTSSTAHPHIVGQEAYNMITKYGPVNHYQIRKMDKDATKCASVKTLFPSYMHSFGMSERYYVIAESPFTVQSLNLIAANRPFIKNFKWNKKRGTRIWVIDQKSNQVVFKQEIQPFFFFHFVNTFDTESGVTFDMVTYPDAEVIQSYYLENLGNPDTSIPGGVLKRFDCNFSAGEVNISQLSNVLMELPHIDYDRYNAKSDYRYIYTLSLTNNNSSFYDQIAKIDINTNKSIFWNQEGCFPGEPVFVPSPQSKAEDDGILVTLVLDTTNESSFLLLLDASSMQEITKIIAPDPIMIGFHGQYFKN